MSRWEAQMDGGRMVCKASRGSIPARRPLGTSGMPETSGILPGRKMDRCGSRALRCGNRVATKDARAPRRGGDVRNSRSYAEPEENRSEEHTSELQSLRHLVCRLLLEKKKKTQKTKST